MYCRRYLDCDLDPTSLVYFLAQGRAAVSSFRFFVLYVTYTYDLYLLFRALALCSMDYSRYALWVPLIIVSLSIIDKYERGDG